MSVYLDFIKDFPERCEGILIDYERQAAFRGRRVTHLLAMGAAGLIVPYERLNNGKHPSGDREAYAEAASQLKEAVNTDFLTSKFWSGVPGSWRYGKIPNGEGMAEEWKTETRLFSDLVGCGGTNATGTRTSTVLFSLRNALAHGNVFTPGRGVIEDIIFLSKVDREREEYRVYVVSPNDFRKFLRHWFSFVRNLRMPSGLSWDAAAENSNNVHQVGVRQ